MTEAVEQMIQVGRAMLDMHLQNTHSGNISMRTDGGMLITRSGSMKGRLSPEDIVRLDISKSGPDELRASVETGTHRGVLRFAGAVVHAHSVPAILLSFLGNSIDPVDFLGMRLLKSVPVLEFDNPIGSVEMERDIPPVLRKAPAMVVKTHGPFACADDLLQALRLVSVLDFSCKILWQMNLHEARQPVGMDYPSWQAGSEPDDLNTITDHAVYENFEQACAILFDMGLSPFMTGSMALRNERTMSWSTGACLPPYFQPAVSEISLNGSSEHFFKRLFQRVFRETHARAAIFAHCWEAALQGLLVAETGQASFSPIDAEGRYLYPVVPVIQTGDEVEEILSAAAENRVVLVAGMGVLAIGESFPDALRHVSAMKNICAIKSGITMRGKR